MARVCRSVTALALAWAAITPAACGPVGNGKSEEEKAGDTLTELIDARNQRNFAKACSVIASQTLAEIKREAGERCPKALARRAPAEATITIRVDQVRVSGDRATIDATVSETGGAGIARTILLVKEGGDWKVAQVGF
jgi:hypothetical protein